MNTSPDAQKSDAIPRMTEQERMRYTALIGPAFKESGRTQEDVADSAQVSRNTLAAMIKQTTIPQNAALWRVLVELNVAPSHAMDDTDLAEWRTILVPLLRSVPEEQRPAVVIDMVKVATAALAKSQDSNVVQFQRPTPDRKAAPRAARRGPTRTERGD